MVAIATIAAHRVCARCQVFGAGAAQAGVMQTRLIDAGDLESGLCRMFEAAGCAGEEAARVARDLVDANLTGHDSHGVVRAPAYVDWLRDGLVRAGQDVEVVTDGGTFAVLEAHRGLGQTVAAQATDLGIALAREYGTSIVALRNAGHVGRVGRYAETAVAAGLIAIHFVNVAGSVLVAPFGSAERRFSTAPFAIGLPLPGRPIVLDFATSLVAEGKVRVASLGGKPLPDDALVTAGGVLTGDPHAVYGDYGPHEARSAALGRGAIRAFGEHKGSGLALMCELLGGALTGGPCSGPVTEAGRGITNGMLSIHLSPAHFGTQAAFERVGRDYLDWVVSAAPIDDDAPVLAPGDVEARTRAARLAGGVPIPVDVWESLRRSASALGVDLVG